MLLSVLHRLLLPLGCLLLVGCTHTETVAVQEDSNCPLRLDNRQKLVLTLPSNPTTGYRWEVREAAPTVLRRLGPEIHDSPEEPAVVGSDGQSTWHFQTVQIGMDSLLLVYQRPWEVDVKPAKTFDCTIIVK